jgi:hypothetical protein
MQNAVSATTPHAPMVRAQNVKSAPSVLQAKCANHASRVSHVKEAEASVRAVNVVSEPSVAASAHRATLLSKKWRWLTRPPWPQPVVTQVHQPKIARSKTAKVAVTVDAAMTAEASAVMKAPQHLQTKCQAAT